MTPLLFNRIVLAAVGMTLATAGWVISGARPVVKREYPLEESPLVARPANLGEAISQDTLEALRNKKGKLPDVDDTSVVARADVLWKDNPSWKDSKDLLEKLIRKIQPPEKSADFSTLALLESLREKKNHSDFVGKLSLSLPEIPEAPTEDTIAALLTSLKDLHDSFPTKLISKISEELNPPDYPKDAAEPKAGVDKNLVLASIDYVWIETGNTGFWITKNETGGTAAAPSSAGLRTAVEGAGIPSTWDVGLPTLAQWREAQGQAQALGLENFEGGLGEFLNDGKIIGVSTSTSDPQANEPLSVSERQKLTRRMITPPVAANPGRSPAVPATFDSAEKVFAYRIVIIPPAASE